MKDILLVVLTLITMTALTASAKTVFYISPNGNDEWSGLRKSVEKGRTDGPFLTLERARLAARDAKAKGAVDIILQPGVYYLEKPLEFGPEDSGASNAPVTYKAAVKGSVIISGGKPVTTEWTAGEDGIFHTTVPEASGGKWTPKLLRVGDKWAVRARHPNSDPADPYKGKWLFADFSGETWEKGLWGVLPTHLEEKNTTLKWNIRVPKTGKYFVWLYYSHNMKAFAKEFGSGDMSNRTALIVNNGSPVLLDNLPDTGGWGNFRWTKSASLQLEAGLQELAWKNIEGGGINLDAIVLCDDTEWDASQAFGPIHWWGAREVIRLPAQGRNLLIIQTESADLVYGPTVQMPEVTPPGSFDAIKFKSGDIPDWKEMEGAEVHVFAAWGWLNGIVPIDGLDLQDRKIRFKSPASQDIRMGNRYFIENIRQALDDTNEWFLDSKTGVLQYIPEDKKFRGKDAVASNLDRLIVLKGDADNNRFVKHIRFEGLTFHDTGYTLASDYYTPADAAIWFSAAGECVIKDCDFRWLGGYALRLDNQSRSNQFIQNSVQDMGQGGVILYSSNGNLAEDNLIGGNTFQRLGLIYKHVAGVYLTCASRNRIVHNTISDVPRYGIAMKSFSEKDMSRENIVEFNDIRRCNLETNDTGGIEMFCGNLEVDINNVIRHNIIFDSVGVKTDARGNFLSPHISWGIYLDNNTSGCTVYGNIIARNDWGGICIHNGRNNLIENNIFVNGNMNQIRLQPWDDGFMKGNRFLRNIICYTNKDSNVIYAYPQNWKKEQVAECNFNIYWLNAGDLDGLDHAFPEGSWARWQAAGYDRDSLIADPMFRNPEKDDYRLPPDSPAFRLGFKRIPVEKIGVKGWSGYTNSKP